MRSICGWNSFVFPTPAHSHVPFSAAAREHTSLIMASRTYQNWKRHTRMRAAERPSGSAACLAIIPKLRMTQPMRPGRSSQKNLMSKLPMRGLSSWPMKKS